MGSLFNDTSFDGRLSFAPRKVKDAGLSTTTTAATPVDETSFLDSIGATRTSAAPATTGTLAGMSTRDTGVVANEDADRVFSMYSQPTIDAQRSVAQYAQALAKPKSSAGLVSGNGSNVPRSHPLYRFAREGESLSDLETRLFGRTLD